MKSGNTASQTAASPITRSDRYAAATLAWKKQDCLSEKPPFFQVLRSLLLFIFSRQEILREREHRLLQIIRRKNGRAGIAFRSFKHAPLEGHREKHRIQRQDRVHRPGITAAAAAAAASTAIARYFRFSGVFFLRTAKITIAAAYISSAPRRREASARFLPRISPTISISSPSARTRIPPFARISHTRRKSRRRQPLQNASRLLTCYSIPFLSSLRPLSIIARRAGFTIFFVKLLKYPV